MLKVKLYLSLSGLKLCALKKSISCALPMCPCKWSNYNSLCLYLLLCDPISSPFILYIESYRPIYRCDSVYLSTHSRTYMPPCISTPSWLSLCVCSNIDGSTDLTHSIFLTQAVTFWLSLACVTLTVRHPLKLMIENLPELFSCMSSHIVHSYSAISCSTGSAIGSLHGLICAAANQIQGIRKSMVVPNTILSDDGVSPV